MTENIIKENKFTVGWEISETGGKQPAKWYELPYRKMYQIDATNTLGEVFFRKNVKQLDLFLDVGVNGITYTQPIKDNFSLTFLHITQDNPIIGWNTGADKMLKCLAITFTEQVDHQLAQAKLTTDKLRIVLPLRAWAKMIDISDNDMRELKTKARKELQMLYNASINYNVPETNNNTSGKPYITSFSSRILSAKAEVSNGNIIAEIAPLLGEHLVRFAPKHYPTALLRLDTKNTSYPYAIGNKLYDYLQTKNAHASKEHKTTTATISVRKLLETVRLNELDKQIKEQRKKGELTRRFITPLEKALSTLVDKKIITDWCYTRGKRDKVSDKGVKRASFDDLLNMYIEYTMPLPDLPLIEQGGI